MLTNVFFDFRCPMQLPPIACLNGTYSTAKQEECTTCPLGHYCPTSVMPAPVPCVVGYYANVTGVAACTECEAAYKCLNASINQESKSK